MDITQRDKQIAAQFMEGKSVPKLSQESNLSESHINRILDAQGVDRAARLKPSREIRVIDDVHRRLGQRLYDYRTCEAFEERPQCAVTLGWSPKKLAMVEQGHTVLTVGDLMLMAKYMKRTVSQLFENI